MLTHRRLALATGYLLAGTALLLQAVPIDDHQAANINRTTSISTGDSAMGQQEEVKTQVPVIGVLTQVLRDYKHFTPERHLHLASSYVKWIETSGAQVLPILLNMNDSYYERVFKQTNGLLLPGGDNLLNPHKDTPMMVAAKKLYKLAVEANKRGDFYPIWGTCLGMELLSVLSSGENQLDACDAQDDSLVTNVVDRGRLFASHKNANLHSLDKLDYSKLIVDTFEALPVAYNHHQYCLTDDGLKRAGLEHFYKPLAYSHDRNGFKFIAMFEAKEFPFYGVQFHPEKSAFEFTTNKEYRAVSHSRESIEVSRYLADFFVRQAQRNSHRVNRSDIRFGLIYAYNPMYTAPLGDIYEQRYLFPFSDASEDVKHEPAQMNNRYLTVEFIDYLLRDGEVVSEDLDLEPSGRI